MFDRHVVIDWSGAGRDNQRTSSLAVVEDGEVVAPPSYTNWNRDEVEAFLAGRLTRSAPRTLVALDAALSFPWGFAQAVFDTDDWRTMVDRLGALAAEHETARLLATSINARFDSGPFRFDDSRNDHRFYRTHSVGYFRAVELSMPQCISPFYLGSGATVGFHAITALSCLSRLMRRRDTGALDFSVWPFEPPARHVVVECYPAMFPAVHREGLTAHQHDALRVSSWVDAADDDALHAALTPWEPAFGRRAGVAWSAQLELEGWVLGV